MLKENRMGTAPVGRLLLTMSLPMMLSMLVQALYNIIDSLFIAAIPGEQFEYTAINLAFPAQNLMIAIAVGTGVGINALASRNLGMGEGERAKKIAGNGLTLLCLSWVLFAILGIVAVRPFYEMLTDIPEVIEYGTTYLSICFIGSIGLCVQVAFEKFMQSTGKTTLSMIVQLSGAITNIIFDPILIFGYFGFPKMGIAGAAIATVAGQMVSMIVGIILNRTKNSELAISLRHLKLDRRIVGEIYKIGVPSILMSSVGSVMTSGMNIILGGFNKAAIDTFGTYFKLQSFVFMPVFGLNNGLISIVAYNYGAEKRSRMMKSIKWGIIYAGAFMLVGLLIFQLFPEVLLGMFTPSAELLKVGVPALRTISLCFVFASVSVILTATFQALGHSLFSMIVSIARQLVILLPAAYLLSLSGNVDNVWWSFPIAELICVVCCVIFFKMLYKKIIAKLPV